MFEHGSLKLMYDAVVFLPSVSNETFKKHLQDILCNLNDFINELSYSENSYLIHIFTITLAEIFL